MISSKFEEVDGTQEKKIEKFSSVTKIDSTKAFMSKLTFKKPDGSQFSFSEVKGKIILLDFWATWCAPCIKQHPTVEELYKSINDSNFEIVTVSVDKSFDNWKAFIDKNRWKGTNIYVGWDKTNPLFEMVMESIKSSDGKTISKVSVPQYYLITKSLDVIKIDDITDNSLEAKIQSLLN